MSICVRAREGKARPQLLSLSLFSNELRVACLTEDFIMRPPAQRGRGGERERRERESLIRNPGMLQ